jgi:predicted dehydrogenase
MTTMKRLGVVGCGRAYQRLYGPALRHVKQLQVVGATDPRFVPASLKSYPSLDRLLAAGVDCVLVLTPPAMHADHVGEAIEHGVQVLVEKPPALSSAETTAWAALGGDRFITPAFSRRYWPQYRTAPAAQSEWRFELCTDPRGWGPGHVSAPIYDLLPHAIDLARWCSNEEVSEIEARKTLEGIEGTFALEGGRKFRWDVGHTRAYSELLEVDGAPVRWAPGLLTRIGRRLGFVPQRDVDAVAHLLRDWAAKLDGGAPTTLPGFADARRCVEVLQGTLAQLPASATTGSP